MDRADAQEVAALLRERADLIELLAGECFEIKLVFGFVPVTGGDRSIEHYLTRNDALFDPDVHELIFELIQKRLGLIDQRLSELGVRLSIASSDQS